MTTAPRVIAPRKKGNLDTRGQSFAGVEGKTVRQIEAYLMEGGDEPAIRIDFADGTALDIVMGSNPDLKAEWMRTSDEKDGPLRRAKFIAQR